MPEMCVGDLGRFIQQTCELHHAEFLQDARLLDGKDMASILREFTIGKNFIATEFAVRLNCMKKLPLRLLGLGHPDPRVGRTNMAVFLVMHDSLEPRADLHPLTLWVLSKSGELRSQASGYLRGGDIAGHPGLNVLYQKALFVPNVDSAIERKHAELKKSIRLATNHSPAFA